MKRFLVLRHQQQRGMTLVELMIVVAIVGILASIGGVAFYKQIKSAKTTQLQQLVMEMQRGEEEFRSRHGAFYPLSNTPATSILSATSSATVKQQFQNLLGFKQNLPAGTRLTVHAGPRGSACTGCPLAPDNSSTWFMVVGTWDLDGDPSVDTTVYIGSGMSNTVTINEGK